MTCCDIFDVFDEKNNLIKEYDHWKLLVRQKNTKLGSCVLITKRHAERFSDLNEGEIIDFLIIFRRIIQWENVAENSAYT